MKYGSEFTLTSSEADTLGVEPVPFGYPLLISYAGDELTFVVVPLESMNQNRFSIYTWNLVTGSIQAQGKTTLPQDISPAGARIRLDFDADLPYTQEPPHFGFVEPYNLLVLMENRSERALYHNGERMVIRASFIENGQKVIVTTADAAGTFRREIINLDGMVLHTEDNLNSIPPIYGTPDGFLMLEHQENGTSTLTHMRTEGGSLTSTALWESEDVGAFDVMVLSGNAVNP